MLVIDAIKHELRHINFDFVSLIIAPNVRPFSEKDYLMNFSLLIQKLKLLQRKQGALLNELDQYYIEDENKFDRIVKQWDIILNRAFDGIVFNFSKGILNAETIKSEQKFFVEYMKVQAKIWDSKNDEKTASISLEEWGVYYAYTLCDFKQKIKNKVIELKAETLPLQPEIFLTGNTLQTVYTTDELKKLHKALIAKGYIAEIKENDFVYWLSCKPLNGMPKIKWIKKDSRKHLAYLLTGTIKNKNGICIDFSFATANKCFEITGRKLRGNDRPINGYDEIDNILETLRP